MVIIYAAFLVGVGIRGNSKRLGAQIAKDTPGFVPWLVVVFFLTLLNSNANTKPIVNPFVALAVIGLLVNKRSVIFPETQHIYDHYAKGTPL